MENDNLKYKVTRFARDKNYIGLGSHWTVVSVLHLTKENHATRAEFALLCFMSIISTLYSLLTSSKFFCERIFKM